MYSNSFSKNKRRFLFQKAKVEEFYGNSNTQNYSSLNLRRSESSKYQYNPLKPAVRSLMFFGLHTSFSKNNATCCFRFLRFVHTASIFLSLHYWTLLYFSYFVRSIGTWKIFNQAMIIWTSTATYDVFLFHRKKVISFISLFYSDRLFQLSKPREQKYSKTVRILNICVWIYLILWVATFLGMPTKKIPREHFTGAFYNAIVNRTTLTFQKYLIQFNDGYLCLLVEGNLTFITVFYIMALHGCVFWFKEFERIVLVNSKSKITNISDVKSMKKMYDILSRRVQNLDEAFSMSVLFWYFMVTVALCIRVIAILGEDSTGVDIQGMLTIGFGLFRGTFVILIGISFSAQYLIDTAQNVVLKSDKIIENSKDYFAHQGYSLLLRKIQIKPVIVTLWKFCPIGKPFLMSCVQTMTTYVIICLQMQSTASMA